MQQVGDRAPASAQAEETSRERPKGSDLSLEAREHRCVSLGQLHTFRFLICNVEERFTRSVILN